MAGFVPLNDATRRRGTLAPVTIGLIALNAIMFVMELVGGDNFVMQWSAIPAQITHGQALLTLFTSMFMHSGWMHIIGNMVYLWAFGPEMEEAMGAGRFLVFYILGGLVAMFSQVIASPNSTIPTLGASGAIAAVMGAFIVTYPKDRIRALLMLFVFIRVTYIPAALLIGFWFLMQVFDAGRITNATQGGVAYLAHIGGFLFGVILGRLFDNPKRIALSNQTEVEENENTNV